MGTSPHLRADGKTLCRNVRETSKYQDCRERSLKTDVVAANLSACRDPWSCYKHNDGDQGKLRLCREMHDWWFAARRELEDVWEGKNNGYRPQRASGGDSSSNDYCLGEGRERYLPMAPPINTKQGVPAMDHRDILKLVQDEAPIQKSDKHFDPEKITHQFGEGHPKHGKIVGDARKL